MGLATAAAAVAVPAGAEALAPASGCRWADGNKVTIFVDTSPPLKAAHASQAMKAAAGWNRSGYIEIRGAPSAAQANIVVRGGSLAGNRIGETSHGLSGFCAGQAKITIDNNRIVAYSVNAPVAISASQSVLSHEIGHALGLGEDQSGNPEVACPDGRNAPITVMYTPWLFFASGKICNPELPTQYDIDSINARYK